MAEILNAANQLTWPGAFAVVGISICVTLVIYAVLKEP